MKRRLAIIDDEPSISMIIELNLSEDYQITSLQDLDEFNQHIQENEVDALVLDLNLSGESGKDLIPLVRGAKFNRVNANIPIVVLSGEDSTDEKITCLNEGADDYLVKPFNPMELKARINRIFARIHER
tara:strand:+ start:51 stop:437 length:387 start_codon:yes stop_codon:yes gene_type:complete